MKAFIYNKLQSNRFTAITLSKIYHILSFNFLKMTNSVSNLYKINATSFSEKEAIKIPISRNLLFLETSSLCVQCVNCSM